MRAERTPLTISAPCPRTAARIEPASDAAELDLEPRRQVPRLPVARVALDRLRDPVLRRAVVARLLGDERKLEVGARGPGLDPPRIVGPLDRRGDVAAVGRRLARLELALGQQRDRLSGDRG